MTNDSVVIVYTLIRAAMMRALTCTPAAAGLLQGQDPLWLNAHRLIWTAASWRVDEQLGSGHVQSQAVACILTLSLRDWPSLTGVLCCREAGLSCL